MQKMLRTVLVVFATLIFTIPGMATEAVFRLVKLDGSTVEVTQEDMTAAGRIDLKTKLVARAGDVHVANGPRMRDLLAHLGASGGSVDIVALDGARIEIPVNDFDKYDAIVATDVDGKPLSVRERGPAWLIYPLTDHPEIDNPVYEMRSIWQIKTITMK